MTATDFTRQTADTRKDSAIKRLFSALLRISAFIARIPLLGIAAYPLMWLFAATTSMLNGGVRRQTEAEGLGREWQRLMPSKKWTPINEVRDDTAYGEILVACPLRGSGDLRACHRLMEYDRALMRRAGGRFVVLQSQAERGVETCRIAIRPLGLPGDGLTVHESITRGSR